MTITYSRESYDSSGGAPFDSTTTEYKFSDGSRWLKIQEETFRDGKPGNRTRVLRSDFEGDKEHRSSMKELQKVLDAAEPAPIQVIDHDAEWAARAAAQETPPAPVKGSREYIEAKALRLSKQAADELDSIARWAAETANSVRSRPASGYSGHGLSNAVDKASDLLSKAEALFALLED